MRNARSVTGRGLILRRCFGLAIIVSCLVLLVLEVGGSDDAPPANDVAPDVVQDALSSDGLQRGGRVHHGLLDERLPSTLEDAVRVHLWHHSTIEDLRVQSVRVVLGQPYESEVIHDIDQSIIDIVCSERFDWNCSVALSVAWCESRGGIWLDNFGGSGATGLFAIMLPLHQSRLLGDPYDHNENTRVAHELWTESGGSFLPHWRASYGCWGP